VRPAGYRQRKEESEIRNAALCGQVGLRIIHLSYGEVNVGGCGPVIQFNTYLFARQLNSPGANYKVSMSERKETNTRKVQNKAK
jgi:hypothetical protein